MYKIDMLEMSMGKVAVTSMHASRATDRNEADGYLTIAFIIDYHK